MVNVLGTRRSAGAAESRRGGLVLPPDGRWNPPPLDTTAYLACVARCRDWFPGLRILTGMELGEPHWHEAQVKALPGIGDFDRLLGSLHSVEVDGPRMVDHLF